MVGLTGFEPVLRFPSSARRFYLYILISTLWDFRNVVKCREMTLFAVKLANSWQIITVFK